MLQVHRFDNRVSLNQLGVAVSLSRPSERYRFLRGRRSHDVDETYSDQEKIAHEHA